MKKFLLISLVVLFSVNFAFAQEVKLKKGEIGFDTLAKIDLKKPKLACTDAKKFLDMMVVAAKEKQNDNGSADTNPVFVKNEEELNRMVTVFENKFGEKEPKVLEEIGTNLFEIMVAVAIEMEQPNMKNYAAQVVGVSNCGEKAKDGYVAPMDYFAKEKSKGLEQQAAPKEKPATAPKNNTK